MKANKVFYVLLGVILLATPALSMDDILLRPGTAVYLDELNDYLPDETAVLNAGAFDFTINNIGSLGNDGPSRSTAEIDPCTGNWAPQLEYPRGSDIQYFYKGGIWIGAEIEVDGEYVPRVSVAAEGWFSSADPEYSAASGFTYYSVQKGRTACSGEAAMPGDTHAALELVATMTDTALNTPTGVPIDHPHDGVHLPLGVKVTQSVAGYSATDYDRFAIIEYNIENMGQNTLRNLCVGLYMDGDVGLIGDDEFIDDISGFLGEYDGHEENIAWIADADGRSMGSGNYDLTSVFGVTALQSPDDLPLGGYNWWISNGDVTLDFGPAWQQEDHWTNTYGTPFDDAKKYEVLRNGEIDYPQYYVDDASWIEQHPQVVPDPDSGEPVAKPWMQPDAVNAPDLANGYDTRFLMSWGPIGNESGGDRFLAPGENVTLALAVLIGNDFHSEERPQPENDVDPSLFDYSDLVELAHLARELYANPTEVAPPAPPMEATLFRGFRGNVLGWSGLANLDNISYNIFRRPSGSVEEWPGTPLNSEPVEGLTFVDDNCDPSENYEYCVQALRFDDTESYLSRSWDTFRDMATLIRNLETTTSHNRVEVTWEALPKQMVDEYEVFRTSDPSLDFAEWESIGRTDQATYTDNTAVDGGIYWYAVTAKYGAYSSVPEYSGRNIPMEFSEELLLLLEYSFETTSNFWSMTDIRSFYTNILDDLEVEYDIEEVDMSNATELPISLLSPYKTVWIVTDRLENISTPYKVARDSSIILHSAAGGNVMVTGRHIASNLTMTDRNSDIGLTIGELFNYTSLSGLPIALDDPDRSFEKAVPAASGFPELTIDRDKALNSTFIGALYGIETNTPGIPLYSYASGGGETSSEGEVMGQFTSGTEKHGPTLLFTAPLYGLMPQSSVEEAVAQMLALFEETAEEAAGHGNNQEQHSPQTHSDGVQIHPNPFNAVATVSIHLNSTTQVGMCLYNLLGQEVLRREQRKLSAGDHHLPLDGRVLPSGLYFLQIRLGNQVQTQKVILLK